MSQVEQLIDRLAPLIGVERSLHEVNYAVRMAAHDLRPEVVGALQVSCSDESEHESVAAFQSGFAQYLLPRLKFAHRSPMRTANLGGRFEWGSLRIAESHFAAAASSGGPTLIVVKINSHVGMETAGGARRYGVLRRYGSESPCCGALAALLDDATQPRLADLREQMASEGADRLVLLRRKVAPELRSLAAALCSARLQARVATLEAQDHTPATPTLYLILPVVTLNRPDRDAELLVGVCVVDRRGRGGADLYRGLGDLPDGYQAAEVHGRLRVGDGGSAERRPLRDHRRLVHEAWRGRDEAGLPRDGRVEEALAEARRATAPDHHVQRTLLKVLLLALTELSPVPAALLLFSEGAAGIYHAFRAHRLVEDVAASPAAREILADLHAQVDRLPPEEVHRVLQILAAEYDRR